ncbi:putative alpha/gamma-adaptin-binding protein p34 [Helianthus anomalus]
MWPGMVLKSGDTINQPTLPIQEEPSDDTDVSWVFASKDNTEPDLNNKRPVNIDTQPSTSQSQEEIETEREKETPKAHEEADEGDTHVELEDMELLLSEIGSMRDSLRLMPDFQRREMAANLAMKMASMFGGSSGDEEEQEE